MMDISRHGTLDEGVQFIHKPFSRQDLAIWNRMALEKKLKYNSRPYVTNSDLRVILCWKAAGCQNIGLLRREGFQKPLQQREETGKEYTCLLLQSPEDHTVGEKR
jgi:hypothetical protein